MPHIEVLPNSTSISAPGWAYVPDTGYDPSKVALQPSGARKRAARASNIRGGESTTRQNNAVLKHLAELDKDNHRDVQIAVPIRQRDAAGRVSKGKVTQAVRRILMSQKTFANHLADEEAALAAQGPHAPSSSTPRAPASKAARAPSVQLKRSSTALSTPAPAEPATAAPAAVAPGITFTTPRRPPQVADGDDPLLRSYIPSAPSEAIMEALISAPPLSYNAA
ncbi:hypothetical protein MMC08_008517, partial [Hypocenomyce scalaris]|nr:hypothetical protein [Hypocenomyce scalaris]